MNAHYSYYTEGLHFSTANSIQQNIDNVGGNTIGKLIVNNKKENFNLVSHNGNNGEDVCPKVLYEEQEHLPFILFSTLKIIIIGTLLFCLIYTSLWDRFQKKFSIYREIECILNYCYAFLYIIALQLLQQN